MKAVWDYILARLKEPSTWAGIATLLIAIGPLLANGDWKAALTALASFVAIGTPEAGKRS